MGTGVGIATWEWEEMVIKDPVTVPQTCAEGAGRVFLYEAQPRSPVHRNKTICSNHNPNPNVKPNSNPNPNSSVLQRTSMIPVFIYRPYTAPYDVGAA